jgi:hypothetical protein
MVLLSTKGWSQLTTSGTINGTVTDSTGGVVPQAAVTVFSEETQLETHTESNRDGGFVVSALPPGRYKVTIVKNGFETFTENGIVLSAAQVATVNAVLTVGQVSTEVNVQASAAQVQTSTAEVSNVVSENQVGTLPLNGRNYQSLSFLMPGVTNLTPDTAQNQGGFLTTNSISVNGMGVQGTQYYVDGIWNENTGSFTQTTVTPNPDTLQEVRLLQNNFGTQYSLNGSNVLLLETKSGTEKFHGSAFDYLRNDALNARNFFSPTVPALKQNIFGYTVAGPVYIPGHYNTRKDQTFFFWSEQWAVQHAGNVVLAADPTAAMRAGTFTTAITDPTTGQPFPQSSPGVYQIPSGRLNAQSLILLNAIDPLPNNPSGGFQNYINLTPAINNTRDDEIKVDQNFGPKLRLMGEYLDERQTNNNAYQKLQGIPFNTITQPIITDNQMAQLRLTQLLSSSMVNTTSVSMNNYIVSPLLAGLVNQSQLPSFQEVLPFHGYLSGRLPTLAFAGGYPTMGVGYAFPVIHASDLEDTLSDDWSWLRGKHYLRAGVQYVRGTHRQNDFAATAGLWQFTGRFTGNPIADYLLGDANAFQQVSTEYRGYMHFPVASPYFEDQWKVSHKLTVTLGMRYSFAPTAHYEAQQTGFSNFVPSLYNPANAPIINNNGTITSTPTYDPLNGVVFLGKNGVPQNYSNKNKNFWNPTFGFAYDVFGNGKTAIRGGYGITHAQNYFYTCQYTCENNYPLTTTLTLVSPTFPDPTGAAPAPATAPTLTAEGQNITDSYVQTYSLGVERQFGEWFASITGAGNVARKLGSSWNINQPRPEGGYNFNPIINTGTVSNYASSLAGASPYQGYGALPTFLNNYNAYWNGLEVNVKHPVGRHVFFSSAYTWQHGLNQNRGINGFFTNSTAQDIYHPGNENGTSNTNANHVLAISGIWSIPFFANSQGFAKALLGGWQYSDITTLQSGFALDPGLTANNGYQPGLATRPNRVASTIKGPKTRAQWFNTAAFANPAVGFFGNAAPGSITGPGAINFDMAVYKDFKITERQKFQFRAEIFNVFNHTNFAGVSTAVGAGNYGQVTSARDPRIAEFALRYDF